jgi:multidrug efflux pump subunit AcrA (membrane-fusion protein)
LGDAVNQPGTATIRTPPSRFSGLEGGGHRAGEVLLRLGLLLLLAAGPGCGRGTGHAGEGTASSGDSAASGATPVEIARAERATLPVTVSGPGSTEVLQTQRVRAPFAGILTAIAVAPGDEVRTGQRIGTMVEQTAYAALEGARGLKAAATTPAEREDAERALALARQELVEAPLVASVSGVVVSRSASPGDRIDQGEDVAGIAATGSLVFDAELPQSDALRVHIGDGARIRIAGGPAVLPGVVRAVLPADSASTMTNRVRIGIDPEALARLAPVTLRLFGTAEITVGRAGNALVVPRAAILRDDITGTNRIALVEPDDRARWIEVQPGVSESTLVEILSPPLHPGQRVIVSGQVGLPDSARIAEAAPETPEAGPAAGTP